MWRMKELIAAGKIESMGDMEKGWKDFDVRLPGAKQEQASQTEEATA
jgi:hypothetical protein